MLVKYDKKDDKSLDYCMRILDDTVEDKGDLILLVLIQKGHYIKQIYQLILQIRKLSVKEMEEKLMIMI